MDDEATIREVDPEKAQAVLTIRLFIPGLTEGAEDRYYLTRTPPPRSLMAESVTHNPDGSSTTVSTYTPEDLLAAHCTYADERTANGRGCGYGKTVSILGRSADEVEVHLSMYWTAQDGSRGDLDEEVVVPWLGVARAEFSGAGWLEAEITPVSSAAEPSAAADSPGM
jgi:hypothetical protein